MGTIQHVYTSIIEMLSHPLATVMIPMLANRWLDDMARRAKDRRDRK